MKIAFLRRGINIKASVIFLSWMMLFAHGIMPHNHAEADCKEFAHASSLSTHNDDCRARDWISSACEGERACSISNILFHKFGQDGSSDFTPPDIYTISYPNSQKTLFGIKEYSIPNKSICSVLLRAPPVT